MTRGNIAELAATGFFALLVVFAVGSNKRIQRRTVQWRKVYPPNPRLKTAFAVISSNIAKLAAKAFVALLAGFAVDSNNRIQRSTVAWRRERN